MASKASMGMVLNLDDIYNLDHRRDLKNIILGENTQRMLIAAERHNLVAIKAIFAAHNLACDDIGYVCGDGVVRISYEGYERINLAAMLIWENAPRYRHYYQSIVPKSYGSALSSQISISLGEILDTYNKNLNHEQPKLITVANISKIIGCSWLFYDYLLISNAFEAGKRAVWQGALALSAAGISPGAVAFIYQSGALEKEALMTSFKHCVDGISFACRDLTIPVTATHVHLDTSINKPSLAMGVVGTTTRVSHNDMIQRDYPEHHIIALLGELPAAFSGAESSFKHYPENPPLRAWEYDCIAALSAITYSFVAANHALYTTAVGAGGVIQALFDLMNVTHCGVRLNFGTEWLLSDIPVGLLSQDSPCILTCLPQKNLESLVATCAQKVPIHILGSLTKIRSLAIYHDDKLLEQRLFFQN
jgi:phosphoribosylformylglycinamidine (FGAM) synthase-like enzyme